MSKAAKDEDIRAWRLAETVGQMAELTARYIEGNATFIPGYEAPTVDSETGAIAVILSRLNRAGCMTVMSQPGIGLPTRKQRALVAGFAETDLAMKIARLSLYSDLLVLVVPAQNNVGLKTLVVLDENHPRGWMGVPSSANSKAYTPFISGKARRSIDESWSVLLIDLEWGREGHLWALLDEVISKESLPHPELTLKPHPDMGLEAEYFH